MKKLIETPLKYVHLNYKATLGEFADWEVVMAYTNSIEEHLSVRNKIGMFDVSHMGRIIVKGKDSKYLLDYLITKNVLKLNPGKLIIPTAMLNEKGCFIDDLSLFMLDENEYLIVCNAINRRKVYEWIILNSKKKNYEVKVEDITLNTAMIALQGRKINEFENKEIKMKIERENFLKNIEILGIKVKIISRSGWTGEGGYEIITSIEEGKKLWKILIEKGIKPCGIIARDSLRLEAGFLLYGNEIDENIDPIKARYWIFTFKKGDYIGKNALEKILEKGVEEIRIGIVMKEKGPLPRKFHEIYSQNKKIGYITSGSYSPILNKGIAMGYVKSSYFLLGGNIKIKIRNKFYEAKIIEPPFFKK